MSVADYMAHRAQIMQLVEQMPSCWIIVANSVHSVSEHEAVIALFDTREQAIAYVEMSKLGSREIVYNSKRRVFRPDSLLWDYNDSRSSNALSDQKDSIVTRLSAPLASLDMLSINPAPPSPDPSVLDAALAALALAGPLSPGRTR